MSRIGGIGMTKSIRLHRLHMARCLIGVALFASGAAANAAEWPAAVNLSTLDGTTGFRLDGEAADHASGSAAAAAGDVNGDGLGDTIIGAFAAGPNGLNESGSSYIVFGQPSGFSSTMNLSALDGISGFRLNGVESLDQSGHSVSGAGDLNGDGFGDVVIGARFANGGGSDSGSSYVVFGKAGGFSPALDLSALDGANGFRLDGAAAYDRSGYSVSAAGDVNGDGFADVIVGAPLANSESNYSSGSSYVVFGSASGFASVINLSALDGASGFRLDGAASGDYSGTSVSAAGDVNGDGFGDLIVGATGADPNGNYYAGSTYVVFGKASGISSTLALSSLDGTTGFRLDGEALDDAAGISVSAAGDINGDGFTDVIIGAFGADSAQYISGVSYVVFGKAGGFDSVISLSGLEGSNGFRLNGVAEEDRSGRPVGGAGDVNGDGFADLIVGAPRADNNGGNSGSAYVMFGKANGFSSSLDLSSFNGTTGFRLDGVAAYDVAATSASTAGDVNGDGFGDLIVGSPGADLKGSDSGSTFVVFGRAPDAAVTRVGSAAAQYITGGAFADNLDGLEGNDVLEGRGGGDALNGGTGTNTASYAHAPGATTANLVSASSNTGDALGDSYTAIHNLEGSGFGDKLTGNGGANRLTGGKGKDRLKGGKGKDTIAYRQSSESLPATRDEVLDFNPGKASTSVDTIDLSAIDAKTGVNGNQAFKFRGTKAFTGAGQVRLKKTSKGIVIQANTGGSKAPEFEILLKGLKDTSKITAKDFKL